MPVFQLISFQERLLLSGCSAIEGTNQTILIWLATAVTPYRARKGFAIQFFVQSIWEILIVSFCNTWLMNQNVPKLARYHSLDTINYRNQKLLEDIRGSA